jgi:hypothetical protein
MRMLGVGVTAAVLLLGLTVSAASADDSDGDLHSATPKPKSWWDGWFAPAAKPAEKKTDTVAAPVPAAPSPVELAAAARQREKAAYFRRMAVCDQLMAVADLNNDDAMRKQIEQLKDRAWDLYQQRIAALPAAAAPSVDEAAFDRKKPSKSTGRPWPLPADKAGNDDGQASLLREGNP